MIKKDEGVLLLKGDCMELMKEIPDGSIDLVCVSVILEER